MEEPGGPRPTVEELQSLTVVKLRQRLAQYGIPQSGNKAALVERLDKFYTDRDAKAQAQQQQAYQSPPAQHYREIPLQEDNLHVQQQLQLQLQQQQEQQQLQLQQQQQLAAEQAAIQERQRQEDAWRQQQLAAAQAAEQQLLQEEHARALAAEQERRHQEEALRQQQLAEQAAAERERQIFEQRERQRLTEGALRNQQLAAHAAAEQERQLQMQREEKERRRLEEERIRQQMLAAEAERQRQIELQENERRRQEEMIRQQHIEMQAAAERQRIEQMEAERQKLLLEEKMRLEANQRLQEEELQRQNEANRLEKARRKQLEEDTRQKRLEEEAEQKRLQEIRRIELKDAEKRQLENQAVQPKPDTASTEQPEEDTAQDNEMRQDSLKPQLEDFDNALESGGTEGIENRENGTNRKQPLFKASIGGMRSRLSQPQPMSAVNNDAEDLDGQSTPAGPMPKSKGGPVPLMSLEIKPPSPAAAIPSDEELATPNKDDGSVLPKALEQALALKGERAHEMGVHPEDIAQVESDSNESFADKQNEENQNVVLFEDPEMEEVVESKGKQRQKGKKKKKKKNRPQEWARQAEESERKRKQEAERQVKKELYGEQADVEVEYIQDKLELDMSDPMFRTFSKIFEVFKIAENEEEVKKGDKKGTDLDKEESEDKSEDMKKVPHMLEEDDMVEEEEPDENKDKLSKRKLKKLNRLSVAELKQLVSRPDVVEMHDVTAKDPNLLVSLKATRNTVAVPRHWCFKRKYLQGKRGIEKAAFDLPDFIKKTGIMEMRAALQEKEVEKNMKSKMREKVRPKLGKIDIDYQKLHDAFFKWQTKPRMTYHGDLYYEGKEFEIRLKEKKPGDLSDDLRTALGMPVGPNAHKVPPPWLIAMQRYGPPPSYPNLKIPGLNAPIPDGCSFGYHAGGWGKPPVDETGKPLYGDVFGTADAAYAQQMTPEEIDTTLWGEMESESEEEESSEEEEDEEDEQAEDERVAGAQTPLVGEGLATPSGMSSVGIGGLGQETPELLELRKKKIEAEMEGGETPNLYTVLPERRNERIGASMMGSTHTYDLGQAGISGARQAQVPVGGVMGGGGTGAGGVEMALNPEEVDLMDTEAMAAKAEAALRDQQANLAKEDLSDMVAEHAAKAANKRKRLANKDEGKSGKKYKEFKF